MVVDVNSGRTLFARNADAERFPASLTKMMTLYILFEELDAKHLTLASPLTVSDNAARQPPSKLGLKSGSTVDVEDAILALVTKSANDVAIVIAENIGGNVDNFAARMNRTARTLGMTRTTFRNPNGLPDADQQTTAHDLIRLGQALQDRFPTYYAYFKTATFTYHGARIRNHNHLLSFAGVDGIKTGYTRASGFNVVTNVQRDGRHVIAVVMGGDSASGRDANMRELIDKYIPQATRGPRTAPLLVANAATDPAPDPLADSRVPRSRPDRAGDDALLAYASPDEASDPVSTAMAEAKAAKSDDALTADAQGDVGDAPEEDPIAHRIEVASDVAEFADLSVENADGDPIGKLAELLRKRAGVQDVVATAADDSGSDSDDVGDADAGDTEPAGWNIQIGAVPTAEAAQALIEKARSSAGPVLASAQPLTQEVARGGTTLYRARFTGFSDKDEARAACVKLKSKAFSCLAVPN